MLTKPSYEELEKRIETLEIQLQESEQNFKALFEKGPIGVAYHKMVYDDSGKPIDYLFLDANKNFQKLTGVNPVGKRVTEAFPGIENDPFDWIEKYADVAQNGKEFRTQQYLSLNNRWYDVVGYQYKPDHFVAAFIDITEHKQAIDAMHASERRFKALIKNSSDSIVILNEDGIQTYVSDAVERHLGFKPHEVTNIPVIEKMIHPDDIEKTLAAFNEILEKGEGGVQYRHKHKNGSWVHLEAWGTNQLKNPDISGVVVNVRNITEWKKAEEALKKSEERYRLIEENITDVIWTMDMDFCNTYTTPSIYQQRGYTVEEVKDQPLDKRISPDSLEKVLHLFNEKISLIKEGDSKGWNPVVFEIEQPCKDGSVIWTNNTVKILPGPDNQPSGFLGTSRDITDRKKAEDEKFHAQKTALENEKYALVGQIAGKMAHDFNNVLGAIMGNTELALIDCTDDETIKTLELIFDQTLRGKNLTRNLVAFAKDQEPKQEYFSINEKIDLVLNLLKKDMQGIEIYKEWLSGLPDLLADPGMVEHCLVNLLQNSIHATGKSRNPTIILRTYQTKDQICVDIEDNGCGIPKEFIQRIFEPAFTLKGSQDVTASYQPGIKGTGYGMANVKKYIEQHKGSIAIVSEVGMGTKLTIGFPEIKKELSEEEIAAIQEKKCHFEKYILLVEDEQAIADVQYKILTHVPCNHKVDMAANGQVAIDLIDRNDYDCISLDYILPGGISGMDVYAHIRKTNKTLPILFISGNLEFLESMKGLKQKDPYIDHLSKPCQNKDYINRLNGLLDSIP